MQLQCADPFLSSDLPVSLFSHVSLPDCAVLRPLLLFWKAKIPGFQSAASTPGLMPWQRRDASECNLHPLFIAEWGLLLCRTVKLSEAVIKADSKEAGRGHISMVFAMQGIKTGPTFTQPCCWNPCKSAEWHMSLRFITETDNATLCRCLFRQQNPHSGAADEKECRFVFECHSGSAITNETGWYAVDMYKKCVK